MQPRNETEQTSAQSATLIPVAALAILPLAITITITVITMTMATTTAGTRTQLLLHRSRHLLIRRSAPLINRQAKVLIHRSQQLIKKLPSLKEPLAKLIIHHRLPQLIKLGNLRLRRRHTLHMLMAKLLPVLINLAEQIRRLRILVKQTNARLRRNNLLALSKRPRQLTDQLDQLRCKRCI